MPTESAFPTRRQFLRNTVGFAAGTLTVVRGPAAVPAPFVQTVLGPVPASALGLTLAHEHVMCDFIGAGVTGRSRWEVEAVVRRMQPVLAMARERGVKGFIDCTPAYIGRDPRVLKQLAAATGLHLVTNTGYYGGAGDKFVPAHAHTETVDQLADRWVREWTDGIEDTGVKPGFIKTGVDEIAEGSALTPIDAKLVAASARASKRTGLAVVCHTGGGAAGLAAVKTFIREQGDPDRFIVAHSDGHGPAVNREVASLGAWVSFDAISRRPLEEHLRLVQALTRDHAGRVLLSHDNGWYWVGQENGGEVRDFNHLSDVFLPAFRNAGGSEASIRQLTVENPARAFAVRPPA
jgi:phosphotriesterase-related protein